MRLIKPFAYILAAVAVVTACFIFLNRSARQARNKQLQTQLVAGDSLAGEIENLKQIKAILETLAANPSDSAARTNLLRHIQTTDDNAGSRDIIAGLKSVYALIQLGIGEKNGPALCEHIRTQYAGSEYAAMLKPLQLSEQCPTCAGKGIITTTCPSCLASGNCAACGGKGSRLVNHRTPEKFSTLEKSLPKKVGESSTTVTVEEKCTACGATGLCPACQGERHYIANCRDCGVSGQIFSKNKIKALLDLCLNRTLTQLVDRQKQGAGHAIRKNGDRALPPPQSQDSVDKGS
jgi:hypothetical protein